MKRWFIFFVLAFALSFSACTTAQKRVSATTSRGVYAIQDSLKAGRVDLAQKYAQDLTRVVPAPKKHQRIIVKPVVVPATKTEPAQKYVVLPQEYSGTPALTLGTAKFDEVVQKNPTVQKQLVEEEKTVQKFEAQVDKTQQAVAKEAAKPKQGFFSHIFGFLGITGLLGGLVVIGGIVLLALNPEFIPVVMALVGRMLRGLLTGIGTFFQGVFRKK